MGFDSDARFALTREYHRKMPSKSHLCNFQSGSLLGLLALILFPNLLACAFPAASPKELTTPGMTREFVAPLAPVRQAVVSVQKDHIIHGTLIFDKDPILTGAEAVDSPALFDPGKAGGEVFKKIRNQAIAPRHFLESADQGIIAVRYVITPVTEERTRVHIDAVYAETAHRVYHASAGSVEKAQMKEIKDALDSMIQAEMDAADARRRATSRELVI